MTRDDAQAIAVSALIRWLALPARLSLAGEPQADAQKALCHANAARFAAREPHKNPKQERTVEAENDREP